MKLIILARSFVSYVAKFSDLSIKPFTIVTTKNVDFHTNEFKIET